jgi:hypothetical protein
MVYSLISINDIRNGPNSLPITKDSDDTGVGAGFKYTDKEAQRIHPLDGATDRHQTYESATDPIPETRTHQSELPKPAPAVEARILVEQKSISIETAAGQLNLKHKSVGKDQLTIRKMAYPIRKRVSR